MSDIATDPDYAYWREVLAGRAVLFETDKPQCGFYFRWLKNGDKRDREPVAIFRSSDASALAGRGTEDMVAVAGFERRIVELSQALWISVASHPLSDDVFWDTVDNARWADVEGIIEPPETIVAFPSTESAIAALSNRPPEDLDPVETTLEQINNARRLLEELLADGVKDQATADRLANSKDRLAQLRNEADDYRKKEKKPHDDASAAVQKKWKPLVDIAQIGYERAQDALTAWQKAERRRLEEEAEEANRIRLEEARKAEEARLAAAAAGREAAPAPEPVAPAIAAKPRAGGAISGKRTGLRTTGATAVVDDWAELFATLSKRDDYLSDVRALAQGYADRAARAGVALAGCKIMKKEKSV